MNTRKALRTDRFRAHGGFTLVEIMVAVTVGLIILAAVAQIFVASRSTSVYEEGMARVQESGRFAMEFLTKDIRMAGYTGCLNKTTTVKNHLNNSGDPIFAYGQFLTAHVYTGSGTSSLSDWTPALPGAMNGVTYFSGNEVMPYTDVVVIRRGDENSFAVTTPYMTTTSAALKIKTNSGLSVGDIVIVADCKVGDIFQITGPAQSNVDNGTLNHNTGSGQTPGNFTQDLLKMYTGDAEIMKITTRYYYLGKRGGNVTVSDVEPALFRKEFVGGSLLTEELVEGIEYLRLLYGEDTDSDKVTNIYRSGSTVSDWSRITSVRVGLVVRTPVQVDQAPDTNPYALPGYTVAAANDKRRRHVYSATVQLRN